MNVLTGGICVSRRLDTMLQSFNVLARRAKPEPPETLTSWPFVCKIDANCDGLGGASPLFATGYNYSEQAIVHI